MRIFNKTGHRVVILNEHDEVIKEYLPDGHIVRIKTEFEITDSVIVDGSEIPISVVRTRYGDILPQAKDDIKYIVSAMVREFYEHRTDLLSPDPTGIVYTKNGFIKGCKGFIKN